MRPFVAFWRDKMPLQLNNLLIDSDPWPFTSYEGRLTDQMPLLIAANKTPLSLVGVWKKRLEALKLFEGLKKGALEEAKKEYSSLVKAWWDYNIDTGDSAVRHSDGRLKLVPDSGGSYFRQLTPKTPLAGGAVSFSDADYCLMEGVEFTAEDVEQFFNKILSSKKDAKNNPGLLALAGGNKSLLEEVVERTFAQGNQVVGYAHMMGIYVPKVPESGASGGLLCGSRLYTGSIVYSRQLDSPDGRLVGVAQEARAAMPN